MDTKFGMSVSNTMLLNPVYVYMYIYIYIFHAFYIWHAAVAVFVYLIIYGTYDEVENVYL